MGGLKEASRICSVFSGPSGDVACLERRVCKTWKEEEEDVKACRAARKEEHDGMEEPWEAIGAGGVLQANLSRSFGG